MKRPEGKVDSMSTFQLLMTIAFPSSELSSQSDRTLDVHFYERSFETSQPVVALVATSTKFGMTAKNIIGESNYLHCPCPETDGTPIVATKKNQIQSIPRRLLDPRRPKGDPTAQQQEEMLIKYDPVLPADPRLVISHRYEVCGNDNPLSVLKLMIRARLRTFGRLLHLPLSSSRPLWYSPMGSICLEVGSRHRTRLMS